MILKIEPWIYSTNKVQADSAILSPELAAAQHSHQPANWIRPSDHWYRETGMHSDKYRAGNR